MARSHPGPGRAASLTRERILGPSGRAPLKSDKHLKSGRPAGWRRIAARLATGRAPPPPNGSRGPGQRRAPNGPRARAACRQGGPPAGRSAGRPFGAWLLVGREPKVCPFATGPRQLWRPKKMRRQGARATRPKLNEGSRAPQLGANLSIKPASRTATAKKTKPVKLVV